MVNIDVIDFLVSRKYPSLKVAQKALTQPTCDARYLTYLKDAENYRFQLGLKPSEELNSLYNQERVKEREEQKAKQKQEEQQLFFHSTDADADFEHWSKAKHWSIDEAIALSLGKAPEIVNWKSLNQSSYSQVKFSTFTKKYNRIYDLAIRAMAWKEMFDPVLPGIFIAWAKNNDLEFPKELEEKIIARGNNIGNWKTAYDNLKTQYDTLQTSYDEIVNNFNEMKGYCDQYSSIVEEKNTQIGLLITELENFKGSEAKTPDAVIEKPVPPKAKDSMLKMIIGMATDGYGYDPKLSRSPIPKEISSILALKGISVDEDTVRKWLREAAEFLPTETEIA